MPTPVARSFFTLAAVAAAHLFYSWNSYAGLRQPPPLPLPADSAAFRLLVGWRFFASYRAQYWKRYAAARGGAGVRP